MEPLDQFRAIPGSIDISVTQKMHLDQQILTSCDLLEYPELSVSSIATHQLMQGGHLTKKAGTLSKTTLQSVRPHSCTRVPPIEWRRTVPCGALKQYMP